jgi:proton-dependent oligopeptide transporter, POT family
MMKNHPKGLPYLFFSEMWERFGYYLMIGILTLYMIDTEKGGLGMSDAKAQDIFGTFIALVFLTPYIGGLLADRVLGLRTAITIGGVLMGVGYLIMFFKGETALFVGMGLVILGNGFFKPNISTLLGNIYNDPQYKSLKDSGYSIFYLGINIGAFICNFFAAYLKNKFGWGHAFAGAGIGMFVGLIVFWIGMKHYRHADVIKPTKPGDMSVPMILAVTILPAIVAGILGWFIPGNLLGSDSNDAFIFGALPVVFYFVFIMLKSPAEDRKPMSALMAVFAVSVVFWAIFKQNGTTLTLWAKRYTDREMPQNLQASADQLYLLETVKYQKSEQPLTDEHFRKLKDENGNEIKGQDYPAYFKNYGPKTSQLQEGDSLKLISTEIFQSVNPFFVVFLTPLVVAFFAFLRKRNREPSTASKMLYGVLFTALSATVMIAAVHFSFNGTEKAVPGWLIANYGIITLGELCLSPMGLSLVSKLSPPRLTALMMGGWFLSTSLGNKLSGIIATTWDGYSDKSGFFLTNCIIGLVASGVLLLFLKWLNGIIKEYNA